MNPKKSKENISILHVIPSAKFGGIEKLVLDLSSQQMNNKALDIGLYFLIGTGELLSNFNALGLKQYFNSIRSGYDLNFAKYRATYKCFKQYDVIHFHVFNPLVAFVAKLTHKKIVFTMHSVKGYGRAKKKSDSIMRFLLKKFLNNKVDYTTYNSKFTRDFATEYYNVGTKNAAVIYNGLNFKTYELPSIEKKDSAFTIATHSRFIKLKRIDVLIDVFAEFCKVVDAKLLLIGDGPERLSLERLVIQKGIESKVEFTGFMKNPLDGIAGADVCVYPTTTETFGLSAIEAFYAGKPVIVFEDGGGIAEIVSQFKTDDVVNDKTELLTRLNYYYSNREELVTSEEEYRNFALNFSIEKMEQKLEDVYHKVVLVDA